MANWNRNDVINNCTNIHNRWQGVNWNINARYLFTLLKNATTSRNRDLKEMANDLLETMTENNWSILAGGHAGGLGGGGHGADPNPHVTLRAAKHAYHLRYRVIPSKKEIILVSITR